MEKQLVNLEMVRIKRKEEKREGMEVFMQGGKYGIALDGKEVCAPQFTRIERLPEPYFALCFYPYDAVFRGKVTVVDAKGRDLRPELYGKVECRRDFLRGMTLREGRSIGTARRGGSTKRCRNSGGSGGLN